MAGEESRDVTAPAISESEMPAFMDQDAAASLLAPQIDQLLGLTLDDEGEDEAEGEDQPRDEESGAEGDDKDDETSEDDQEETQSDDDEDEDEDDAEEDDQGDDQSDDDSEVKSDSGLFVRNDKGKLEAANPADIELDLEIAGEQQTVTLHELREGYLRQDDYTRKTQAFAQKVASKVDDELREKYVELDGRGKDLDAIIQTFAGIANATTSFQDLLRQNGNDVDAASRQYDQIQALRARLDDAKQAVEERDKRKESDHARDMAKRADKTIEIVRDTVPEWKSESGFKKASTEIQSYLKGQNMTGDDIMAVLQDPKYLMIVRDAMHGAKLRSKKADIRKKRVAPAKRTSRTATGKPAEGPSSANRAQLRKRSKQGSQEASLKLIEGLL